VRWGDRLPPGIEATVDVTNLLAEGYRPFLSADGRTLYLAESPRTIQAGLSFKF
jgi:outer membrane receptor protein involved in Fe transport